VVATLSSSRSRHNRARYHTHHTHGTRAAHDDKGNREAGSSRRSETQQGQRRNTRGAKNTHTPTHQEREGSEIPARGEGRRRRRAREATTRRQARASESERVGRGRAARTEREAEETTQRSSERMKLQHSADRWLFSTRSSAPPRPPPSSEPHPPHQPTCEPPGVLGDRPFPFPGLALLESEISRC